MGWIADLLKETPSAARYRAELEDMEKENHALKAEVQHLREEMPVDRSISMPGSCFPIKFLVNNTQIEIRIERVSGSGGKARRTHAPASPGSSRGASLQPGR